MREIEFVPEREQIHLATAPRAVGVWLLLVAALVAAMTLLGGATRLTQSGLSIVEWQPLVGVLPPLSEDAWQQAFEQYQRFPEYQKLNRGMSLSEFRAIFWFEYAHRLLGRVIGLTFLLPFLWFVWRRQISTRLAWGLGGVFLLGGLQGLVGWWMVASGLVDRPDVSQYRLAVHLGLAVAILGLLARLGWRLVWPAAPGRGGWAWAVLGLVYLQLLSGALVAGLDGGLHYNTFPDMNGYWLPSELWAQSPSWRNLFENATTVQFDHRIGAYVTTLAVLTLWWHRRGPGGGVMLLALAAQVGLGITTLVLQVPVPLGVMHQAGALVLFLTVLWVADRGRLAAV